MTVNLDTKINRVILIDNDRIAIDCIILFY